MSSTSSLPTALNTTLALVGQLSASLENDNTSTSVSEPCSTSESLAQLPLLSAAAKSLKAQVTKLSLLAITPPFTPSATVDILSVINHSILPALITAALLMKAEKFTDQFRREAFLLTKMTLRELEGLVKLLERRNDREVRSVEVDVAEEKENVTEATGRVWDGCDALVRHADEGVTGFVVKQAGQYLALVKDAVEELEEWEPGEDEDGYGGLIESDEDDSQNLTDGQADKESTAELASCRVKALAVLRRIPMSLHAVIKNRLQRTLPADLGNQDVKKLETILEQYKLISSAIDDAAGTLYEGDIERSQRHVHNAKMMTVDIVESLLHPWRPASDRRQIDSAANSQSKEDRYMQRALDWIKSAGPDNVESYVRESPQAAP